MTLTAAQRVLAADLDLSAIEYELADRHLMDFIRAAWPVIEPGTEYRHNWHIECIAEHLEAVTAGEITRLIINVPPRYMKSIAASVMWPVWEWTRKPETRWMFASYSEPLATKHNMDRRTIIESEWYQRRWGDRVAMAADENRLTEFSNTKRGRMKATSTSGGTATGLGGNRLLIDDPHNPLQTESKAVREQQIMYFDRVLTTRLDDKRKGAIVIIMQRLHEQDLTGHVIANEGTTATGGEWVHLKLPAQAKVKTKVYFPISGRELLRPVGHVLWPEREDAVLLAKQKRTMGSYAYAGQYEQEPSPGEGAVFKREWWSFYHKAPERIEREMDVVEIHVDATFKSLETGSYVCIEAWGRKGADAYLIDESRGHWDFVETCQHLEAFCMKHPRAIAKVIEGKANGPAIMSTLKRKVPGLVEWPPKGYKMESKEARAAAVSPLVEAGNVWLPDPSMTGCAWVVDYIDECAVFPKSDVNDRVDTTSQALTRLLIKRRHKSGKKPKGW